MNARVGLGCMALTGVYGAVERQTAIGLVHRALDLGIRHFDTAELYGPYANEELLAEALGARGNDVEIATKFGYRLRDGKIAGLDSSPANIRRAVEGSLRRLRRDRIDILYQHRADPAVPIEDVVGVMSDLVREGKVRALGLSAVDWGTLQRAQAVSPVSFVQNEYSLIQRAPETELLPRLKGSAVRFVCYSPLGRGILAGKPEAYCGQNVSDYRRNDPRFEPQNLRAMQLRLSALREIAEGRGVNPAAVALAWLLSRGPNIHVIPGAKSALQLEAAVQGAELTLAAAELAQLDRISA